MTLHEAIVQVLKANGGGPMKAGRIAALINHQKLYFRKDKTPVPGSQVLLRVRNYSELFEKTEDGVRLRGAAALKVPIAKTNSAPVSDECPNSISFKTKADIEKLGFTGFETVDNLQRYGYCTIPDEQGVYMILRPVAAAPSFVNPGTGGYYKGKDPNVPVSKLKDNWIKGTACIYIGKATSLRSRLGLYMRFGEGKPVGHKGGRLIWQLADAKSLLVCWKPTRKDPREVEAELIQEFKKQYGDRPFANLVD